MAGRSRSALGPSGRPWSRPSRAGSSHGASWRSGLPYWAAGSGVFFIALLAEFQIATAGWRLTYVWLGAISGGLIVLAAFFLVRDPAARGSMP